MEKAGCAVCQKPTGSELFLLPQTAGRIFRYHRCTSCGLIFLNPRPDAGDISWYYDEEYYRRGERKFRNWVEIPRFLFARQRARRLQRFIARRGARKGRVLDVGCGQGTFLRLLKREGWEVLGTELSEKQARRAVEAGLPVTIGDVQEGQFPPASLDLITLWEVIEHLRQPAALMKLIRPMLSKRAIVAISTPNIAGLGARTFREKWFCLDPPRHLYLFSPKTLEHLMNRAGFRLIHLRHFSLEQDPYGWLQSALNRMSFPENTLYRFMKNIPRGEKRLNRLDLWKIILVAMGLFPTCLALSVMLGWRHRGGTIEAFFEKAE